MARLTTIATTALTALAIIAIALWPTYVKHAQSIAHAASLPTMAPVLADYKQRDKEITFWEGMVRKRNPQDMLSPRQVSAAYLQRYREHGDIGDVLRAEQSAKLSLARQPRGNIPGELQLASVYLTLHRFKDALAVTKNVEAYDVGDERMYPREASLDMELGKYEAARRKLESVRSAGRDDGWRVIYSRYLELTGHLLEARELLATATAYQNAVFDNLAQQRAWYFFREGEMAFEAGDNDAALADERQSLAIFPNYVDATRAAARFNCALQRWQDCLTNAVASAAVIPYPETLGYEADAQRALGDTSGAKATDDLIRTVERIGNAQHISDRLLAIYYSEHHLYPHDAYAIAKRELAVRNDIFTQDTLAWAAAMDGRWDEARTEMKKAIRFDTENSLMQYHAGVIANHFGERDEARRRFERALALNAHFHATYADDARAQLSALRS